MGTAPVIDVKQFAVQEAGAPDRSDVDPLPDPLCAAESDGTLPDLFREAQPFFIYGKGRRDEARIVGIFEEARLPEEKSHMSDMVQRLLKALVRKDGEIGRHDR
jgi:hypothetical protein